MGLIYVPFWTLSPNQMFWKWLNLCKRLSYDNSRFEIRDKKAIDDVPEYVLEDLLDYVKQIKTFPKV